MKKPILVLLSLLYFSISSKAQNNNILFWWSFDNPKENTENKIKEDNQINNPYIQSVPYNKIPPDLSDKNNPNTKRFRLPRQISFEAWVSLGAYS